MLENMEEKEEIFNPSAPKDLPTQQYLQECFRHDEETGKLYWRFRPEHHFKNLVGSERSSRYFNKEVGSSNSTRYLTVILDDKRYRLHRIIWKMYYGVEPPNIIDHINGVRNDNRICNLRGVNLSQNNINRSKLGENNTTGYVGVTYSKKTDSYLASIQHYGKNIIIGRYKYLEEAAYARELKCLELYGEEFYYRNENKKILIEELKVKVENLKLTKLIPKIRSTITNKLGYNGVEQTKGGRFRASFAKQGCGCFDTVEEAALAYEYKLIEVYGRDHYSYSNRDEILNDLEEKMKVIKLGRL